MGGVERRGTSPARPLAPCCLLAGCSFPPFARCRRHCTLEEQSSAGRIGAWQRWLSPLSLAFSYPLLGGKRLPAPPTILSNVPPPSTMLAFRRLPRQPTFRLRYVPPLDLHHLQPVSPRTSIPRSTHTPCPVSPLPRSAGRYFTILSEVMVLHSAARAGCMLLARCFLVGRSSGDPRFALYTLVYAAGINTAVRHIPHAPRISISTRSRMLERQFQTGG